MEWFSELIVWNSGTRIYLVNQLSVVCRWKIWTNSCALTSKLESTGSRIWTALSRKKWGQIGRPNILISRTSARVNEYTKFFHLNASCCTYIIRFPSRNNIMLTYQTLVNHLGGMKNIIGSECININWAWCAGRSEQILEQIAVRCFDWQLYLHYLVFNIAII